MLIFDKELKVLPTAGHRGPGSAVSATSRRGGGPAPALGAPGRQSPAQLPLPWPLGSIRPSLFSKARCSALELGVRAPQQRRREWVRVAAQT